MLPSADVADVPHQRALTLLASAVKSQRIASARAWAARPKGIYQTCFALRGQGLRSPQLHAEVFTLREGLHSTLRPAVCHCQPQTRDRGPGRRHSAVCAETTDAIAYGIAVVRDSTPGHDLSVGPPFIG